MPTRHSNTRSVIRRFGWLALLTVSPVAAAYGADGSTSAATPTPAPAAEAGLAAIEPPVAQGCAATDPRPECAPAVIPEPVAASVGGIAPVIDAPGFRGSAYRRDDGLVVVQEVQFRRADRTLTTGWIARNGAAVAQCAARPVPSGVSVTPAIVGPGEIALVIAPSAASATGLRWSSRCPATPQSRELELIQRQTTYAAPGRPAVSDGVYIEDPGQVGQQAVISLAATATSKGALKNVRSFALVGDNLVIEAIAADRPDRDFVPGEADTAYLYFELPTTLVPDPDVPLTVIAVAQKKGK